MSSPRCSRHPAQGQFLRSASAPTIDDVPSLQSTESESLERLIRNGIGVWFIFSSDMASICVQDTNIWVSSATVQGCLLVPVRMPSHWYWTWCSVKWRAYYGTDKLVNFLSVGKGMGRGDSRTRRGKTFKGSYGNSRPHAPKTQKTGGKQSTKK